ncbi:thermonuclease family protein [Citrobacter koseri]|uniref:thermonuclease family protein n=1 Tax=Enterobacteriaceae TaxID=543 RepID=UPI000F452A56|nr:thermonuclease family protein [Salmonella enterica]EKW8462734.1 thermonuclease family protein [Enterobacter hormaechei]MBJ8918611.1 thermonuclease family protein [Citrobacter koseri]ROC44140.1 micrococcal nuclease [Klebsiella pneumoniae subsp. pneumoniae]HAV1718724.1 thermonuclease family protein [Enterobacter hormaechei subsp. steigerwaltii]
MKYFLYAFSFLLISSAPAYSLGIPYALQMWVTPKIQGEVIRVIDGDTIEVLQNKTRVRVRLLNIDAPEKKQPFGRWSTNQLKALLAGQSVTVSYTQTDRYGRVLGRVITANGTEANRQQVLKGAAWVYDRYNTDNSLPALQREAQTQKRGLWADNQPVPPWEWRHKNN